MAKILIAVLLVLVSARAFPDLTRLRDFSWLKVWLANGFGKSRHGGQRAAVTALVLPLLLVMLTAVIDHALRGLLFGLPAFLFTLTVLFFCWGPRALRADIEALFKAPDSAQRAAAAQNLRPDPAPEPLSYTASGVVDATFQSALSRWFGVLFWFAVAGPAGALGYRVVQLMARVPMYSMELDSNQHALLQKVALWLDWAPAHLMALTLALVSDFDTVIKTWRDYHAAHGKGYFTLDLGFLSVLARAGIDADVAGDGHTEDLHNPLVELTETYTVLWRMLITWLAVLALIVLAGWVE